MKETGLMFKAPLVRALLDGRKTQTRRIAKPVRHPDLGNVYSPGALVLEHEPQHVINRACPYGQPGDRIYVRETFARVPTVCGGDELVFAADYQDGSDKTAGVKYTPSIHMPKELARIWLEVTGVRVERLQDITEEDAKAEGIERTEDFFGCPCWRDYSEPEGPDASVCPDDPIGSFHTLWESTGGDWAANPWVWVIDFRVLSTTGRPA